VLTEAHSNLAHPSFVTTIDRLLVPMDRSSRQQLVPDLLITIGHNIISRRIKELLRANHFEHWHVDLSGEGLDTLKNLSRIVQMKPAEFFSSLTLIDPTGEDEPYGRVIDRWNSATRQAADAFVHRATFSDLKAFDTIMRAVPPAYTVHMGNSSAVRYILLSDAREDLVYVGNRGVAGIDGCTSTAVGSAWVSESPTLLISGDIAFFYDVNAFWNAYISKRLKIIVINNGGGGIFRIIDGPATTDALEKHFETTHHRSVLDVATMYGLPARSVNGHEALNEGLKWLFESAGCAILEVVTPRLENADELKRYFAAIGHSVFSH
ncbi:MAG: 2-succinyl-5-enolpyruvyl-6-hydroxy-3-cyclohexene-1-carboxylate synthase, partial [Flavobacteriales bacterium]|nr:2-succinyl-5-enolpyruvyl-6-hydroxy-3-cyclohexene-1-carboxylate synthase [Flavobacteriales bacterium]